MGWTCSRSARDEKYVPNCRRETSSIIKTELKSRVWDFGLNSTGSDQSPVASSCEGDKESCGSLKGGGISWSTKLMSVLKDSGPGNQSVMYSRNIFSTQRCNLHKEELIVGNTGNTFQNTHINASIQL